eukprot:gene18075-23723_t
MITTSLIVLFNSEISIANQPITYSLVANAGFFESDEQSAINEISNYQKPVFELLDQLRPSDIPNSIGVFSKTQLLKGGKEDSDVVLSYLETYIKPLQKKLESTSKLIKLPVESDQSRLELLPLLLKGHIIELTQAINEQSATSQAREVQEVQETLAEYLKLVSSSYKVDPFIPARPLTDKELFGPLGCEFWGKKRLEGSNSCIDL